MTAFKFNVCHHYHRNYKPNLSTVFANIGLDKKNTLTEKRAKTAVSSLKAVFLAKGVFPRPPWV